MKNEKFGAELAGSIELKKLDKFLSTKKTFCCSLTPPLFFWVLRVRGGEWSNQGLTTTLLNTLLESKKSQELLILLTRALGKEERLPKKIKELIHKRHGCVQTNKRG